LFHENDIKSLKGFKELMNREFSKNLALNVPATASATRGEDKQYAAANITDGQKETYWATDDGVNSASIEVDLGSIKKVKYILLQEYISLGQRIKSFSVEARKENKWNQVAEGTTVGYKRILKIDPVETNKIRINITDAKACPLISAVEVY
jgi:alpha-L-fucosidase